MNTNTKAKVSPSGLTSSNPKLNGTVTDFKGAKLFYNQMVAFMGNGEATRADIENELRSKIKYENGHFVILA